MKMTLEMGPNYRNVIRDLSGMGKAVLQACNDGLHKGVQYAAGHVITNYLTGQALKRRTSNLARAVEGWMEGSLQAVVGIRDDAAVGKYAWLLGSDQHLIRPRNGKFLTIPIAENLTGSGVPRFTSPRQVEDGFFVNTGGKLLFGRKNGKRGKFRPLFVLVKEVLVQGTDALYDGVTDKIDHIADGIGNEITKRTGAE